MQTSQQPQNQCGEDPGSETLFQETTSWGRVSDLDFSLQLCETLISMEIKNKNLGSSFPAEEFSPPPNIVC